MQPTDQPTAQPAEQPAEQPTEQPKFIRAAGGLLWQECGEQTLVAVVHRRRHNRDWTLPKGKLEGDEPWRKRALLEVKQETGYDARVLGFAGVISYLADGREKSVCYWHMAAQGLPSSKDDEEVEEVVWLPVNQAIEKLTYPNEKYFLQNATPPPKLSSDQPHRKYRRWWPGPLTLQRLGTTIEVFEAELETVFEEFNTSSKTPSYPSWFTRSKQLIAAAKQAHQERDAQRGWRLLKAADRLSLYGLNIPNTTGLATEARAILTEATDTEKSLSSWRRASIRQLLSNDKGEVKTPLSSGEVARAKRILDDQQDNVYYKMYIVERRLRWLTGIALGAVAIWFVQPPLSPALNNEGQVVMQLEPARHLWLAIILVGIMGALVSGFSSSMTRDQSTARIPAEIMTTTVTLARISLAIVTSLVISIFLVSGLLGISTPSLGVLLAVAFASGFSDRLLMRALDSVLR